MTSPSLVLAIDPGDTESAFALVEVSTRRPVQFGKTLNRVVRLEVLNTLRKHGPDVETAIEMVASYGMPVGREVFETCVWIGRFQQTILDSPDRIVPPILVYRRDVKLHHCESSRAKDSNVIQALVDRFAPGAKNYGKGTKADPGWFHGFTADVWQAYALAVQVADIADAETTAPAGAVS